MKKRLLLTLALGVATFCVRAEEAPENYVPYPYVFIGLQGGGQTTFTDFNNFKLITPTASISFGMQFTPVFGARLHANGLWNKGGVKAIDQKYSYNYETTNLDVMINLVNLFAKGDYHPWNVYLIGGAGINYSWNNDDAEELGLYLPLADKKNSLSHNFRVGAMLDYNISRRWSVNLEVSANNLNDRYNSKFSGNDDWQLTAQLGVAYKFGVKARRTSVSSISTIDEFNDGKRAESIHDKTEYATRVDTVWYDDFEEKEVVADQKMERNIFYTIRESNLAVPQAEIDAIADFVKNHKDCRVTVTGYADKGTGSPTINMKYSKERAEKATRGLIAAGVPKDIITTLAKGDTVQPFSDNDKNRVVIAVATGKGTTKERVKVKKFRIEEKKQ